MSKYRHTISIVVNVVFTPTPTKPTCATAYTITPTRYEIDWVEQLIGVDCSASEIPAHLSTPQHTL